MSMAALSRLAGTNETQVFDILNQRTRSPKLETVEKIARALSLNVIDLLTTGQRSEAEREILKAFGQLSQADQARLIATAEAWVSRPD